MSPIQREIAEIAYDTYHNGETMTVSELSEELESRGFTPGSGRGLFRQISTTYDRARQERDNGVADCIASCFTDDNGNYCWEEE